MVWGKLNCLGGVLFGKGKKEKSLLPSEQTFYVINGLMTLKLCIPQLPGNSSSHISNPILTYNLFTKSAILGQVQVTFLTKFNSYGAS